MSAEKKLAGDVTTPVAPAHAIHRVSYVYKYHRSLSLSYNLMRI